MAAWNGTSRTFWLSPDENANLMDPASWTKSQTPVFKTSPEHKIFGPGHNSVTVDERGRDMLVFHARDYEAIKGDPLFDPNRHTRVQRIRYDGKGVPIFNPPVANGPLA